MVRFTARSERDLWLRDVTKDDLETFYLDQIDTDATRMAAFPSRDRDGFTAHWAKILADDSLIKKTIVVSDGIAGNVVSWEQDGDQYVGYWISKRYWSRGIATRALSEFLREVQERPLIALVAAHNLASLRVLEKCGFEAVEEAGPAAAEGDGVEEIRFELRD